MNPASESGAAAPRRPPAHSSARLPTHSSRRLWIVGAYVGACVEAFVGGARFRQRREATATRFPAQKPRGDSRGRPRPRSNVANITLRPL